MEVQQQVCTLDQAKRLRELGLDQDSLFGYHEKHGTLIFWDESISQPGYGKESRLAAYTVAELGCLLPNMCGIICSSSYYNDHQGLWCCELRKMKETDDDAADYDVTWEIVHETEGDTEAEARAEMLIYVIEKNVFAPETINQILG